MAQKSQKQETAFGAEDFQRSLVFSGFWGFVFYLFSVVSLLLAQRRRPIQINPRPVLTGLLMFVSGFVSLGTAIIAAASVSRRRSVTEEARENIPNLVGNTRPLRQALSGAGGAVLPFAVSVGALRLAERVVNTSAFGENEDTAWPKAVGTMALLTGLISMAISRIAGWVARDAQASLRAE
jgi:hypothetical protein